MGYRGEIKLRFRRIHGMKNELHTSSESKHWTEYFSFRVSIDSYEVGDRVGQIMIIPYPKILFHEVQELSETARGTGGFGSTN